jgi:D-aminopeptidase
MVSHLRARDLGIKFDGESGEKNSITDVPGVEVGHSTIIRGEGKEAVRTGLTAILLCGKKFADANVVYGVFTLNGNGELTGFRST